MTLLSTSHRYKSSSYLISWANIVLVVKKAMLFKRHKLKILKAVIELIAVDMVNYLFRIKWAAKVFLHQVAMLTDTFAINADHPIPFSECAFANVWNYVARYTLGGARPRTKTLMTRWKGSEPLATYLAACVDSTVPCIMGIKTMSRLASTGARAKMCVPFDNEGSLCLERGAATVANPVNNTGEIYGIMGLHGGPPTQVFCAVPPAVSAARGLFDARIIAQEGLNV